MSTIDYLKRKEILEQIFQDYIYKIKDNKRYRNYMLTKKFAYSEINKLFIGDNVLEMGSDGGPTSSVLVRWSNRLTIIDMRNFYEEIISRDPIVKNATFIQSKWEDYIPHECFSDIILTDSLEHVQDSIGLLKKIQKWLIRGGRLHIVVPNALSIHRLVGVELGMLSSPYSLNNHDKLAQHVKVYDSNILKKELYLGGYEILELKGIQFKPLSDSQLGLFDDNLLEAFNKLSPLFNEYCAEIYACAT